jgi:hypothetical protein
LEPGLVISVQLRDRSELEAVRRAAWVASRRGARLEIVVRYRPPSLYELNRWRGAAPTELRWRVTGSIAAENLAAEADAVAKEERVSPHIRLEQLPKRSAGDP